MFDTPGPTALRSEPQDRLTEWIRAIAARDERAFAALRQATSARVHAVVARFIKCRQQSEEVVADCFWQVWRTAASYEPGRGHVIGWILTIARSRAIDALRRGRVAARHEQPIDDDAQDRLRDPAPHAQERLELADRNERLAAILRALEPVPRQLLALAFFIGLSHQEIAAHCGLPLGTVKSHLRRALIQLQGTCRAAELAPHA